MRCITEYLHTYELFGSQRPPPLPLRVEEQHLIYFLLLLCYGRTAPHPEQIAFFNLDIFVFWYNRLGGYVQKLNPPGNPLLRPARDPRAEELAEPNSGPAPPELKLNPPPLP